MPKINLKKFLADHYKSGVTVRDVIREAVTNSIHARARAICVDLKFDRQPNLFGEEARSILDAIEISDDGEGFTPENLNHFDEICTAHKDSIGGKGVGRLAFLKFANQVDIQSQTQSEFVEFRYTANFDPAEVRRAPRPNVNGSNSTKIRLTAFEQGVNTQVAKLIHSLCDDLRLLMFFEYRDNHSITITFTHNSSQPFQNEFVWRNQDINSEENDSFEIENEVFECFLFREEAPKRGIVAMLCADRICVEEHHISRRFDTCRYVVSVTSPYLSRRSNLERQRLEIPKSDTEADLVSPISREVLIPKIQSTCYSMINKISPGDIEAFKSENITKLRKYYPFVRVDSLNGDAATLDADEIVKAYRSQQARREDALVDALEEGRHVNFDDISHLASDDLARFIVHRALVIDSLSKMPRESAEDVLHNAILRKRSDGDDIRENNIWLVDDKFLSYSNIFSNETLATIVREVDAETAEKEQRQPDIAAFYSQDSEGRPNKLVIIEFKKPSADLFENNKALMQCRIYASKLASKIKSLREVFAFAIVEISDDFYRDMKSTGFKDVFSLSERVVYNDFTIGDSNDVPLHLYVLPSASLITDAKARNRVFEEVLRFNVERRASTGAHES